MLSFISLILATTLTNVLVFSTGLAGSVSYMPLILGSAFSTLVFHSVISRTLSTFSYAWETGTISDKLLHDLYRYSFSTLYLFFIFYLPYNIDLVVDTSLIIKGGFTTDAFNEVMLLIVLLFLALVSYRRCLSDAYTGRTDFINSTVRAAISLFSIYAVILVFPYISWVNLEFVLKAFLNPSEYFHNFNLADIFFVKKSSVYITAAKLISIALAHFFLHLTKKYYLNFFVNHNFFVLVMILLWLNLFIIGLDNLLFIIVVFDGIAMATAAFIVKHEKDHQWKHSRAALNYMFLSVFSSMCAYSGIFFLYTQYHSFSFSYYFFFFEGGNVALPNGFVVLGWFLIAVKLVFLLGIYPFYNYFVEIGSMLHYPSIFYWSVISKLPVIVYITKFISVIIYIDKFYFYFFWITILLVSVALASIALSHTPDIKTFFAYSSLVNISTTVLFSMMDWKSSVFVVLVNYSIYAVAMFGVMLFMSLPRKITPFSNIRTGNEINEFENLHWGSQEMIFSWSFNSRSIPKEVCIFFVKFSAGFALLVMMGAAPFAGFLMKFLLIAGFAALYSKFACAIILFSIGYAYLGYFGFFNAMIERIVGYTKHSHSEWVMFVDEDDFMYFQLVFFFCFFASIFCFFLIF
jgi:NADH:ubiquinone oxidoreductase subunit 2 (subunit N)